MRSAKRSAPPKLPRNDFSLSKPSDPQGNVPPDGLPRGIDMQHNTQVYMYKKLNAIHHAKNNAKQANTKQHDTQIHKTLIHTQLDKHIA